MKRALWLMLALAAWDAKADNVLHLYNWNNYISGETIVRFEKQCGCREERDHHATLPRAPQRVIGPHNSRQRIAVGNPDRRESVIDCGLDQLMRMRCAAEE